MDGGTLTDDRRRTSRLARSEGWVESGGGGASLGSTSSSGVRLLLCSDVLKNGIMGKIKQGLVFVFYCMLLETVLKPSHHKHTDNV